MATLDALRSGLSAIGKGASSALLGQRAGDVELSPEDEKRRLMAQQLLDLQAGRVLDGEPTGAARAARTAGDEAIARLGAGLRSRQAAAGTGPAALLAARQSAGQGVAGRTAIERGVTQAAQQSEASDIEALRRGLQSSRLMDDADEEERERKRRKGLLPALLAGAGAKLGGPAGGALGGTAGEAFLSQLGR